MSQKSWTIVAASVLVAAVLLLAGFVSWWVLPAQAAPAPAPAPAPAEQAAAQGAYLFNYSVKFVCGVQRGNAQTPSPFPGEPVVKPGNYATDINIHNYHYREQRIFKKLLILVKDDSPEGMVGREPKSVTPAKLDTIVLPPDGATMDDCNRIWKLAGVTQLSPSMPLTVGYLVILSRADIDVDVVYTAQGRLSSDAGLPGEPLNTDIDVERVQGKRVFVPFNVLQQFPQQPVP